MQIPESRLPVPISVIPRRHHGHHIQQLSRQIDKSCDSKTNAGRDHGETCFFPTSQQLSKDYHRSAVARKPKRFSLRLQEIENSDSSSSEEEEEVRRNFGTLKQKKARKNMPKGNPNSKLPVSCSGDNKKAKEAPKGTKSPRLSNNRKTGLPVPRGSPRLVQRAGHNRRRHHAGSAAGCGSGQIQTLEDKEQFEMELDDSNARSRRVPLSAAKPTRGVIQTVDQTLISDGSKRSSVISDSDMESSSLGILSPNEMAVSSSSFGSASNFGWTSGHPGSIKDCSVKAGKVRNKNDDIVIEDLDEVDKTIVEESSINSSSCSSGANPGSKSKTTSSVSSRSEDYSARSKLAKVSQDNLKKRRPTNLKASVKRSSQGQPVVHPYPDKEVLTPRSYQQFKLQTDDIDSMDRDLPLPDPREILETSKPLEDTFNMLQARTEQLLRSSKKPMKPTSLVKKPPGEKKTSLDDKSLPDVTNVLKSRTDSLLHSKSRRDKPTKDTIASEDTKVGQGPKKALEGEHFMNGSIPSVPKALLQNELISASILSSDAGIGSMPSSMISNQSMIQSDSSGVFDCPPPSSKYIIMTTSPVLETTETTTSPNVEYGVPDKTTVVSGVTRTMANIATPSLNPGHLRSRSKEKGLATKRADLLLETPIVPNTNVGSKLKAMLEQNANAIDKQRKPRAPGKWDAIMNQIAERQKLVADAKPDLKEVKSKVFKDFRPPKLIRRTSKCESAGPNNESTSGKPNDLRPPNAAMPSRSNSNLISEPGDPQRKSSRPKNPSSRSSSRSNSSLMAAAGNSSNVSRSASSASVASQVSNSTRTAAKAPNAGDLHECSETNVDNSDNVSECTLKDVVKTTNKAAKDFVRNNAAAVSRKNSNVSRKISNNNNNNNNNNTISNKAPAQKDVVGQVVVKGPAAAAASHRDQPDLVQVSSPQVVNLDLSRLENLVDTKQRENEALKKRLGHNAKGFEALAITVNHLSLQLESVPPLKKQLEHLKEAQNAKNHDNPANLEQEFRSKLALLQEQHSSYLDKIRHDHQTELELLVESHRLELSQKDLEREQLLSNLNSRQVEIVSEAEDKWRSQLAQQLEDKSGEVQRLNCEWERQAEKWNESRRALEEQLHSLQTELRDHETAVSAKQKGDTLLRSTQNKLSKVMAEVDSLKAVLEMRTDDIHGLRLDKARLEDKLEEFDKMKVALGKAQAQMEDLKAQLDEKHVVERKLSAENRQLYTSVERELNEKKRLTMEKEELQWRMRQSFSVMDPNAVLSMSLMEGTPFDSLQSTAMTGGGQATSLSQSYSDGCPQSLPPFTGRGQSRRCRPMSAPPGKFEFGNNPRLMKADQDMANNTPDSPRVMEVVEKSDSVAWKLEYKELEQSLNSSPGSSPGAKRRSSPCSPSTGRKTKPNDSMSRSFDRQMSCPGSGSKDQSMFRSCVSLGRSNSVRSTRKKMVLPFAPLSESTAESDSLEEPLRPTEAKLEPGEGGQALAKMPTKDHVAKEVIPDDHPNEVVIENTEFVKKDILEPLISEAVQPQKSPLSVNIVNDDLDDDIGDISSSSEIEIDEPLGEVTTPQIEAMQSLMFPAGQVQADMSSPEAEVTLRSDLSRSRDKCQQQEQPTRPVMSKSMQVGHHQAAAVTSMTSSLPTYDLNALFASSTLQDSGGESLMAVMPEDDIMDMSESDDTDLKVSKTDESRSASDMADSLSGVSWSTDLSTSS